MSSPDQRTHVTFHWEATDFSLTQKDLVNLSAPCLRGAHVITALESELGQLDARISDEFEPLGAEPRPEARTGKGDLLLPPSFAQNLHTFFELTQLGQREAGRVGYEPLSITQYLAGHTAVVETIEFGNYTLAGPQHPNSLLEAGAMYGLFNPDETSGRLGLRHTVLGMGRLKRCLSVLGRNGPLVASDTGDLMRYFGASELRRMDWAQGESAQRT